jgi:hypothetical protein
MPFHAIAVIGAVAEVPGLAKIDFSVPDFIFG